MFENEEKQLREIKSNLKEISIPSEQLNDAIQNGFLIADSKQKSKRRKRRKSLWSLAAAVLLLLIFVTSIRVSPAFANAVASIPGMKVIVELIEFDKGLQGIVDNDYFQSIQASQTKDDITLTIGGVILDETGIVISYELEAPYSVKEMNYKSVDIYNGENKISNATMSYSYPNQRYENRREDVLTYTFAEQQTYDTQDFVLDIQLDNAKETTFSIPFTVPKKLKKGKVYTLNKEMIIENQKMTIEDIIVHPLRVAVNMTFDDSNSMEIFNFEDMRIEDEKGEVWSSIQNGVSGFGFGEKNRTFYLQSNYFDQPKKLFFKFNEIQALPKKEAFLLIDLQKKEILSEPSNGKLEVVEITGDSIAVRFPVEEEFRYFLFYEVENEDGEAIESDGQSKWSDDGYEYSSIRFKNSPFQNPLKITFSAYPNYINGDVSIELKK